MLSSARRIFTYGFCLFWGIFFMGLGGIMLIPYPFIGLIFIGCASPMFYGVYALYKNPLDEGINFFEDSEDNVAW